VLQGTGALTAGALAGCLGFLPSSQPTVIDDITFQGDQFTVHLTDGTNVDAIDLRSPDGDLLDTVRVRRQSTVEFSLYAGVDTPYPPGRYTLVAVEMSKNGDSQRISTHPLELTMGMSITDVRTVTVLGGGPPKVQVTVTNTVKLPIKIEYMGFPKGILSPAPSPEEAANSPLPAYESTSGTGQIAPAGTKTTFESAYSPLRSSGKPQQGAVGVPKEGASWDQLKRNHCNGEQYQATLVVVPKYGHAHRRTVTFKYAGEADRRSFGPGYFCTRATVVSIDRKNTSTSTSQ
jgi:hypothetical protein